jgi:hypothetical protein
MTTAERTRWGVDEEGEMIDKRKGKKGEEWT